MQNYFESQKEHIFKNAMVLIYVMSVAVSHGPDKEKELLYFRNSVENLRALSPQSKVFCLIHKFDLIPPADREATFTRQCEELTEIAGPTKVEFFQTSIWDETLYRAWSRIVHSLVPNSDALEHQLGEIADTMAADEVVLFEKATFLVISHVTRTKMSDDHRFEKISNIVKQFKLSVNKQHAAISSLEIKTAKFRAMIEKFTPSTFILLVFYNLSIPPAATICNLSVARDHFRKISEA